MLLKKVCWEGLADDPIPGKTFVQRRVLPPGRISQSITLGRVPQPEGEVHSKVIVEILTYVLGVVHDGNVVFRELSSWSDPRQHPALAVSCVTLPRLGPVLILSRRLRRSTRYEKGCTCRSCGER